MGFALSELKLESTAFKHLGRLPAKYTGEGQDVSPPLQWRQVPEGTRSFAVTCHDPDAPRVSTEGTYGFVHWVLYNIPGLATGLSEGISEYTRGLNDRGNAGYMGPMPPNGHGVHHYFFCLFALNAELNLENGLTLWQLLERIEPHVLGMNRLVGTYDRP